MLEIARFTARYKSNFWKFCLIGLSGAVIQIGLTRLFYYLLTNIHISGGNANTIAVITVIPITTVWNFVWNSLWVFRSTHENKH